MGDRPQESSPVPAGGSATASRLAAGLRGHQPDAAAVRRPRGQLPITQLVRPRVVVQPHRRPQRIVHANDHVRHRHRARPGRPKQHRHSTDLNVRGVAGLRVADASIMPSDCRANLHFTCVTIGEMLARRMQT